MRIFDSHCHMDDRGFNQDLDDVVRRARQADVKAMMAVGINAPTSRKAIAIASQYDGVIASVGVHPHDAKGCNDDMINALKVMASHPKVRAWGETGLDFNRMYSPREDQEKWFLRQLEMGHELQLPMIFHERDSQGRFLEMLRAHWADGRNGVVHCFSGNPSDLTAYLDLGLHIGITGIVTIKTRGAALRQMVAHVPAERLLVETDAPYLTPTPERNKFHRNEPAFVRTVLFKLASVRQQDPEALADTIWDNTCRLFGDP
jgi:TatD DNase family protein